LSFVRIPFFDPAKYRGLRVLRDPGPLSATRATETFSESPVCKWDKFVLPTPAQRGDSCNAEGWCKKLATRILMEDKTAIPAGHYLEPWPVYKRARDIFFPDQGDLGGLFPSNALDALIEMDCVPRDTSFIMPPTTWDGLCRALAEQPIGFGGLVHDGYGRYDPANGCIDHAPRPSASSGGHWMTIIGTLMQGNQRFLMIDQSWGRDMYWHGIMLMTWDEYREVYLAPFMGFRFTSTIADYPGWRKLLRKIPTR
jgi:hypothetical protein